MVLFGWSARLANLDASVLNRLRHRCGCWPQSPFLSLQWTHLVRRQAVDTVFVFGVWRWFDTIPAAYFTTAMTRRVTGRDFNVHVATHEDSS